jgi:hypothetical protein
MNITLKKILVFAAVLLAAGICIGFYLYNKGPVNVTAADAVNISAPDLYRTFSTDTTAAKKYSGKILEVSGDVNSFSFNRAKQKIILLKTATTGAFINCTMETDMDAPANSSVIIKGICSGIGQGDEDLGIKGDVYLTRCIPVKNR